MKAKQKNTRLWAAEDGKPELDMNGGTKREIMEDSAASHNRKKLTFADQQYISKNESTLL